MKKYIRQLLQEQGFLSAVKYYQTIHQTTLLEAKNAVLAIQNESIPSIDFDKHPQEVIKFSLPFDCFGDGAPQPWLCADDISLQVLFNCKQTDIIKPVILEETSRKYWFCHLRFSAYYGHQFYHVNDEIIGAHPLFGEAIQSFAVHEVKNSHWIQKQILIQSQHYGFDGIYWESMRHFVFPFKDNLLEVLAHDFQYQMLQSNYSAAISYILNEIV